MLDLAAGVIWRNLELVVPPPPHFAGDAAPDQLPELVDHSDDEMPELEADSDEHSPLFPNVQSWPGLDKIFRSYE